MMDEEIKYHLLEMEQGHVEEGLKGLEQLLARPNVDDEWRFEVAQSLYQLGFLAQALEYMEQLFVTYPDEPEVAMTLAEWYIEDDQLDHALDILLGYTPLDEEDDVRKILLEAEIYRIQGLYEVTEQKIVVALDIYGQHEQLNKILNRALGEIYFEQELHALAIRAFKRGIEPDAAIMADCYAHVGQFEEAQLHYRLALKEKETVDLMFGAGFTAFRMEEWDQAIQYWTRLLDADAYYVSAYPRLAEAFVRVNKFIEAEQILEKGLRYDETNPQLYDMFAELLIKQDQFKRAMPILKRGLEFDAVNVALLEKMDEVLEQIGEPENRLPYLEQLIELVNSKAEYYLEKGIVHEQLEQWSEAKDCYKKALQADQNHPQALNRLGFLLRDEGSANQALVLWEKSLEIDPHQEEIQQMVLSIQQDT